MAQLDQEARTRKAREVLAEHLRKESVRPSTADQRRYWTQLPNLIDELGLSPYAFRLYVHVWRVVGANKDGVCFQSTRQLAAFCSMSAGMVSKMKEELVQLGLLHVTSFPPASGQSDELRLVDLWAANDAYFAGEDTGRMDVVEPVEPVEPTSGVDERAKEGCDIELSAVHVVNTPVHHMNGGVHHVNPRKNTNKKNPLKKQQQEPVTANAETANAETAVGGPLVDDLVVVEQKAGSDEEKALWVLLRSEDIADAKARHLAERYPACEIRRQVAHYRRASVEGKAKGPGWLIRAIERGYPCAQAEGAQWLTAAETAQHARTHGLTARSEKDYEWNGTRGAEARWRPRSLPPGQRRTRTAHASIR